MEFIPSLCPRPRNGPPCNSKSGLHRFLTLRERRELGVALAAGSDSNKRAARRSPKILQVFSESVESASCRESRFRASSRANLNVAELAQRVPSPAAPAADCQTTYRIHRIRRWWLGSSGGGVLVVSCSRHKPLSVFGLAAFQSPTGSTARPKFA